MKTEVDASNFRSGSGSSGDVEVPVLLQTATVSRVERRRREALLRDPLDIWRRLMTRITSSVEREGLRRANTILVENHWMQEHVTQVVGQDRVMFAPPGVDTELFCPRESQYDGDPYILSVGRFADPRKNVPLLLEGYARLRQEMADAPPLLLAGKTSPTSSDWALAGKLGISDKVEFRAEVSLEELTQLYRNASIFVLASDEEGLGMVVLEAMASGVPVVSTRSGGPEGIISDGIDGRLVPLGDAAALGKAMHDLLSDDCLRNEMAKAARRTIEERFSMEVAGERFVNAIGELVGARVAK